MTNRELIEVRMDTLTRDVERFKDEMAVATVNSKRWRRLHDTLEELAGMLIAETINQEEIDQLDAFLDRMWSLIERELVEWATGIEDAREARRAGVAA